MKIETGIPRSAGRYVCYMHGVSVPTVVRVWTGEGWANHLDEPVKGTVAGFIGPLPVMPAETSRVRQRANAKLEFDL